MKKSNLQLRIGVSMLAMLVCVSAAEAAPNTLGTVTVPQGSAASAVPDDGVPTLIVTIKPMSEVLPADPLLDDPSAPRLRPDVPGLVSTADEGVYRGMMTEA